LKSKKEEKEKGIGTRIVKLEMRYVTAKEDKPKQIRTAWSLLISK